MSREEITHIYSNKDFIVYIKEDEHAIFMR